MMRNLFESTSSINSKKPLWETLRPKKLDDIIGQEKLLSKNSPLNLLINNRLSSLIFWGPPGCGKTTLARAISQETSFNFIELSATHDGISKLKAVFSQAIENKKLGIKTLLFIDEIHRFNKSQQDSFLPQIENNNITLIGATTENPSFALNNALLSRCNIFKINSLDDSSLNVLFKRAQKSLNIKFPITQSTKKKLIKLAEGDARYFLNMLEIIYFYTKANTPKEIDNKLLAEILEEKVSLYDKNGDIHYNLLSAFHKSIRGSDTNASLYWLARMINAGEDPKVILRRMLAIAYEDIGLADIDASTQALNAWNTFERLGFKEGKRTLFSLCIYLSTAPKSNSSDLAMHKSIELAKKYSNISPPKNILNAPTKLMEEMGYGENYKYDHDFESSFSGQNFWPKKIIENEGNIEIYSPNHKGYEREIAKRKNYYDKLRKIKNNQNE